MTQAAIATALYTFTLWLPGKVLPKARPRVSNGQAYLSSFYREWKRLAVVEVKAVNWCTSYWVSAWHLKKVKRSP